MAGPELFVITELHCTCGRFIVGLSTSDPNSVQAHVHTLKYGSKYLFKERNETRSSVKLIKFVANIIKRLKAS